MGSDKARPAYLEEVDETSGKAVRGTRRSASTREKPKGTRDSRPSKRRTQTDSTISPTDPAAAALQYIDTANAREQDMKLERRMSSSNKSPRKANRPPSAHETRGYPKVSIPSSTISHDQSYYGISNSTPTTVSSSTASQPISLAHRPRALTAQTYPRPQSFHSAQSIYGAQTGPPLTMNSYWQQQQAMATPSYPPPAPQSYVRYAAPLQPVQQSDYFGQQQLVARPLASRFEMVRSAHPTFDPISRTTSAFGTRDMPSPSEYDDDGYNSAAESATIRRPRRNSVLRGPPMTRAEADALAMPPPSIVPRAGILRRSTDYPIEAPDPNDYRLARSEYPEPPRPRRPSVNRHSASYDVSTGRVTVESANSGRRRSSYYEQPESTASSSYEQQLSQAASYQEDVTGGPTAPLTAEMLRKQQKREVGSSRSTKSSGSHDESDYKKSATTRTTRSGSGNDDENMTIKVTGQARVMVGGTQIDCTEGGAIEIKREKNIRTGSEQSNSVYGGRQRHIEDGRRTREERHTARIEDGRRTREERPSGRSRMSSSQRSYRKSQQYPPGPDYF